ncbi:MAG: phosphomannomutase, partial [Nitrososphaerales archaeon]
HEVETLKRSLSHLDGPGSRVGKESSMTSNYVEDLSSFVGNVEASPSVAVDPAGGAASGFASKVLGRIGCNVTSLNDAPCSSSRSPDPTSDELSDLRNAVLHSKCDAGFAFDLDGDRLVVVDGNGNKLDADATLLLCVSRAIEMGAREIVVSVDTSDAVRELAEANNCRVAYSKVGEANVVSAMQQKKISMGGEGSSGGFIMGDFNLCRDGLLASAVIAGMLRGKKFQECMQIASGYHLLRRKVDVESALHAAVLDDITDSLEGECSSVDHLDGAKGFFDDRSWVLIRGSNTEESIRISVQSADEERSRSLYKGYELRVREAYEKAKRARNN